MVTYSLPFADQCHIFWNIMGFQTGSGVRTTDAYRGAALSHLRATTPGCREDTGDSMIPIEVCRTRTCESFTEVV
jgi:hypothetical protein